MTSSWNDTAETSATSNDYSTAQYAPEGNPKTAAATPSVATQSQATKNRSSNLCTTDQDCLLDYGSYAAAGLTITCNKDQGDCTFE